jgi:hypothetical protein
VFIYRQNFKSEPTATAARRQALDIGDFRTIDKKKVFIFGRIKEMKIKTMFHFE